MSTIVCLREKDLLILGTDSRFMKHDFSEIYSDAEQKIHEMALGTFIATAGWKMACDFQEAKARELADGTTDIRVIGEALERETIPCLERLVQILASLEHPSEQIPKILDGSVMLHCCVLAGRTAGGKRGKLGYVTHTYRCRAGRIVTERGEYFGEQRQIFVTAGDPAFTV